MGSKVYAALTIVGLFSMGCAQAEMASVTASTALGTSNEATTPIAQHVASRYGLLAAWGPQQRWRGLGQMDRDEKMLMRAFRQNGQYVGVQCKEWARSVVKEASQDGADIPVTANNWSWYSGYQARLMPKNIRNAQPAWVVQMETGSGGPHTAFIVRQTHDGVVVIDSNYVASLTVGVHTMTYDKFKNYSLYQITGGW